MTATRRPRVTANRNMKGFAMARSLAAAQWHFLNVSAAFP